MYLKKGQVVMYGSDTLYNVESLAPYDEKWFDWLDVNYPDILLMLVLDNETDSDFATARILYSSTDNSSLTPFKESTFILTGEYDHCKLVLM